MPIVRLVTVRVFPSEETVMTISKIGLCDRKVLRRRLRDPSDSTDVVMSGSALGFCAMYSLPSGRFVIFPVEAHPVTQFDSNSHDCDEPVPSCVKVYGSPLDLPDCRFATSSFHTPTKAAKSSWVCCVVLRIVTLPKSRTAAIAARRISTSVFDGTYRLAWN